MEPISFILGVVAFNALVKMKEPIRKAAVVATRQTMNLAKMATGAAYGVKEEFEDIIAEAHYENIKMKTGPLNSYQGEVDQPYYEQ